MTLRAIINDDTAREVLSEINVSLPHEETHQPFGEASAWLESCQQCRIELRLAIALVKRRQGLWLCDTGPPLLYSYGGSKQTMEDYVRWLQHAVRLANARKFANSGKITAANSASNGPGVGTLTGVYKDSAWGWRNGPHSHLSPKIKGPCYCQVAWDS